MYTAIFSINVRCEKRMGVRKLVTLQRRKHYEVRKRQTTRRCRWMEAELVKKINKARRIYASGSVSKNGKMRPIPLINFLGRVLKPINGNVPLPTTVLEANRCILQNNLVSFLDIDRLIGDFLLQSRDVFGLDRAFQQLR